MPVIRGKGASSCCAVSGHPVKKAPADGRGENAGTIPGVERRDQGFRV